jgi:acyl-CoA dehydrogenase
VTVVQSTERSLLDDVRAIANDVVAARAEGVDREGRFPSEAIDALRAVGALSSLVPRSHGGGEESFETVATSCYELARACAASGMVYAMHQIQVACLVRHGVGTPSFDDYLTRLASEQRLLASVTSEKGVGGDLRRSIAALAGSGPALELRKEAPTVSYGAHADDFLITCRADQGAEPSDQVLVLVHRSQAELEQTDAWDALGMRGTCSPGFVVSARVDPELVLPVPFGTIASRTMVPFSHLLWAHVWLGIAADAYERARAFVRSQARASSGVPASAGRLSELAAELQAMRAEITGASSEYAALLESDDVDALETVGYAIRVNTVKINASEAAPRICAGALSLCGMAGYRNGTPFSVGRNLRDALSGALMIANERIHATNAGLLLLHKAG